jgi:hypothetical protein
MYAERFECYGFRAAWVRTKAESDQLSVCQRLAYIIAFPFRAGCSSEALSPFRIRVHPGHESLEYGNSCVFQQPLIGYEAP